MADGETGQAKLHDAEPTSIAQLHPELADSNSRVIDGAVTITWPYSVVKKSIAFILAERDFRLRRDRGQVRIEFHGAAGKAISSWGIGGGDDVRLSLEGAVWEKNETSTRPAGSTLEWQLVFTKRLVLEVRRADSEDYERVDIDAPDEEHEETFELAVSTAEPPSLEPTPPPPSTPLLSIPQKRIASSTFEPNEYESPAFVKRARVSYGSLFEGGLDIFDEESGRNRNAKKRSRFSMNHASWRYSSRSPSPEIEVQSEQEDESREESRDNAGDHSVLGTPARSVAATSMIDEGCQTQELKFTPDMSVHALTESKETQALLPPSPGQAALSNFLDNGSLHTHPNHPSSAAEYQFQPAPSSDIGSATVYQQDAQPQLNHGFGFNPVTSEGLTDQAPPSVSDARLPLDTIPFATTHQEDMEVSFSQPAVASSGLFTETPMSMDLGFQLQDTSSAPQHTPYPNVSHDFQPPAHLFSGASQPEHQGWMTEPPVTEAFTSQTFQRDEENPVEITDVSSPIRGSHPEQSASPYIEDIPREARPSEDSHGHDMSDTGRIHHPAPEIQSGNRSTATGAEGEFEDGGDEPGDDYDLRNYDRAHDDDDDVGSEESYLEEADPEAQPADPGIDEEEESYDEEDEEDAEDDIGHGVSPAYEVTPEDGGPEPTGRYYDESEGEEFDEEEESEVEEEESEEDYADENAGPTRKPVSTAPKEPVFISLLSDSEDEDEPPAKSPVETYRGPSQLNGAEDEGRYESAAESETMGSLPAVPRNENASLRNAAGYLSDEVMDDAEDADDVEEEDFVESKEADELMPHPEEADAEDRIKPTEHVDEPASSPAENQEAHDEALGSLSRVPDDHTADTSTQQSIEQAVFGSKTQTEISKDPTEIRTDETPSQDVKDVDEPASEALVTTTREEVDTVEILDAKMGHELETKESQVDTTKRPSTDAEFVNSPELVSQDDPAQTQNATTQEETQAQEENTTVLVSQRATISESKLSNEEGQITQEVHGQVEDDGTVSASLEMEVQATDAPSSPSLLRASQEDPTENAQEVSAGAFKALSTDEKIWQLPTPSDTQQHVDTAMESSVDVQATQQDEDDAGAEEQLMAELQEYSQLSAHAPDNTAESEIADVSSPPAQPEPAEVQDDPETVEAAPETQPPPIYSFRSRRPRQAKQTASVPSISLHTASTAESNITESSSPVVAPEVTAPQNEAPANQAFQEPEPHVYSLRGRSHRKTGSIDTQSETVDSRDVSQTGEGVHSQTAESGDGQSQEATQESQPSTLYSFRGRRHRKSRSTDAYPAPSPRSSFTNDATSPRALRVRSRKTSEAEPTVPPATPTLSTVKSTRSHDTPETTRETRSMTHSIRRSNTPDTIVEALKSPSVAESVTENETVSSVKAELTKSLRNNLPEVLSLKALRNSLNKTTDILAVATTAPPPAHRPKNGPRDYMLELTLTDPSSAPSGVSIAHIFRPHQASLPAVNAGDVVLLRRFQVVSMKGRGFGVRAGDASAWAVFEKGDEEMLPQIKGPPVEVLDEEVGYAEGLKRWWGILDENALARIERVTTKAAQAAGKDSQK